MQKIVHKLIAERVHSIQKEIELLKKEIEIDL